MDNKQNTFFKVLFIIAALWNLIGAYFGYFNTAYTFNSFFGRELVDPLFYTVYQGAWGTTLVYFFGYSIAAYNPVKHTGIVIVGGIGKIAYAIKLLQLYMAGIANPIVLIVIIGDFIFSALFLYYFLVLYKMNIRIT
jgi:hypothetical protein